ncbi:unnamed protein product [Cochlearia groenlandica]
MDSADDDFGELYVDAFSGDLDSVKPCAESECATILEENNGSHSELKNLDVVANDSSPCVDACALNRTGSNQESDYSDSDDDLNIVLKDDDSKAPSASFTNNGGYDSAYSACIDPSLGMLHCGHSHSLPLSRLNFDANLEVFEKKPWRKIYCKPLGRAIEVKSETRERMPSADSRLPRDSDPDVVIQVPVTNDVEELPSMAHVEARSVSITSNEASRSEDSRSDSGTDLESSDDSMKDEAFVGCQEENSGSLSGEQSPSTENCCTREVTAYDKEMIEEENEENFWNSHKVDTSSVESEASLGDRICLSPTSSCSFSRNEVSEDYDTESLKDNATDVQREVSPPPRRARLAEHKAISIRSVERSGTKHSSQGRYHENSSKRHCERADYAVHKHRISEDTSHTPHVNVGRKVHSPDRSFYRDSNRSWQNGSHCSLEKYETRGKSSDRSNREKCHGRLHSSMDHTRHREHRFGWYNNKDSSRDRSSDHSSVYKYEAHVKAYASHSSFNVNQRNYRSSFQEEDDQYGMRLCEEKYGHERSCALAYESNKERSRYDWQRDQYSRDSIPLNGMGYRQQLEYSSLENDLHYKSRADDEYNFHRHRYEDRVHRAESGVPFEVAYREMHSFGAMGRREFQRYERNEDFSERQHYTPDGDGHLDRFVYEKYGCKYRIGNNWPAPSLSLREDWYTNRPRGNSWRDDTRDFTTEAYNNRNNQLCKAAPRDGWAWNLAHSDCVNIEDRICRDRGRYPLADYTQCSMREVTHPQHPSYTDELLVRDTRMSVHNRLSTSQRPGYFKSRIHGVGERHGRSKKLRGDVHTFMESQEPVELNGRQGKLSNQSKKRFSDGRDTIDQSNGQKPRKLICRSNEKAVLTGDLNDKEDGEIIEETSNNMKGREIDNERIQESLKKMEKRRERFKETKPASMVEATFESQIEVTNQQRPIRKRRWCAS